MRVAQAHTENCCCALQSNATGSASASSTRRPAEASIERAAAAERCGKDVAVVDTQEPLPSTAAIIAKCARLLAAHAAQRQQPRSLHAPAIRQRAMPRVFSR